MKLGESIFDISYLVLVISLGLRLIFEDNRQAKLFAIMAMILGIGDSFHLIPRVISHLSPSGLEANVSALSWGKFVTSITMTIFYILYYYFYRNQSKDYDNKKKFLVYILATIRILLTLMPQNNWGSANESYAWGIYRNIPFLILGIFLIIWSYREKEKPGLKNMWWLILLSFAFYIPVVLFADKYPAIGALMMPKTIAYLFIVILGYKYFTKEFDKSSILALSITLAILGIFAGAFSRKFTKYYGFFDPTYLKLVHTHILTLGFLTLLGIYLIVRNYDDEKIIEISKAYYTYIIGFTIFIVTMILKGIYTIVSDGKETISLSAISGISGLGHTILTIGIIWLMYKIFKLEKENLLLRRK